MLERDRGSRGAVEAKGNRDGSNDMYSYQLDSKQITTAETDAAIFLKLWFTKGRDTMAVHLFSLPIRPQEVTRTV